VGTRIVCSEREGQWVARAVRLDNGDPFGVECAAATQIEAVERLERWLQWQREHTGALEALQRAERDYYRTIAASAFANPSEGATAIELQKESLEAVEAARVRLDEIRGRQPEAWP
jgi:hypothetical protein